ncbi:MAG: stage III sporulation protein AE, partial [Oscillospiraceae bacterium]|nr:stage III sporulation protein AE [Oscillospiraceae bacterium]
MASKKICSFLLLICVFTIPVVAAPAEPQAEPDVFQRQLESSGADALADALPGDAREALRQIGVEGIDFYTVLAASPRDIVLLLFSFLQGGVSSVLRAATMAGAALMMVSMMLSALPENEKIRHILEVMGSTAAFLTLLPGLAELLRGAVAVVRAGSGFTLLLVPVLAGIITAAGKPMLALSYHSLTFAAAQGLSQLCDGVIVPGTGIVLGLALVDSVAEDTRLSALAGLIKKAVLGTFAVLAGLFAALLSIKSVISSAADGMALRGAKVVMGSIPLVGPALSEACGAIFASVSLVKGAVGGFALLAGLVLYAPVLMEILLWSAALRVLSSLGELFHQDNAAGVFKSAQYAVSIL